jgi:Family of unknown function (DUF5957)
MKIAGTVVLGVVGGGLAGFALREIVALLGLLLVERPVGLRYLPVALAVAGGLAAAVTSRRRRDREATR